MVSRVSGFGVLAGCMVLALTAFSQLSCAEQNAEDLSVWDDKIYGYRAPTNQVLGFHVELSAADKKWNGYMVLTHERWMNGSSMSLTSYFPELPPEALALPQQESLNNDGDMYFTQTTPAYRKEGVKPLVRLNEYGSFVHLATFIGQLSETVGELPCGLKTLQGNDRQYQSGFLLLSEPATMTSIAFEEYPNGHSLDVLMSNGTSIMYTLNEYSELQRLDVKRGELAVRYTVIDQDMPVQSDKKNLQDTENMMESAGASDHK